MQIIFTMEEKNVLKSEDKLKVALELQQSDRPSNHCAEPTTTNFNDKRTICTLLAKLCCPFTTMDGVHLSNHALTSLLTLSSENSKASQFD